MNEQGIDYEVTFLQFRPIVDSDERLNVGLVLYSPHRDEFIVRISDRYARLGNIFPDLDGTAYRNMVRHVESVLERLTTPKRLAAPELMSSERLTLNDVMRIAVPSSESNFSWSTVRRGYCDNLAHRAAELLEEYVLRFEQMTRRERIDDKQVWDFVRKQSVFAQIERRLDRDITIRAPKVDLSYTFRAGWQNGRRQLVEAISLDYAEPDNSVAQANRWRGLLEVLRDGKEDFLLTAVVSPPPSTGAGRKQYDQAREILRGSPVMREVFSEDEVGDFVALVLADLAGHGIA